MIIQLEREKNGLTLDDVKEGQIFEANAGSFYVKNVGSNTASKIYIKRSGLNLQIDKEDIVYPREAFAVSRLVKTIGIDPEKGEIVIDYHEHEPKQLTFEDVPVGRFFKTKNGVTCLKVSSGRDLYVANTSSKWEPDSKTAMVGADHPVEAISTEITGINW